MKRVKAEGEGFGRPDISEYRRAVVLDRLNAGVQVTQVARDMKTSRQIIMRMLESSAGQSMAIS